MMNLEADYEHRRIHPKKQIALMKQRAPDKSNRPFYYGNNTGLRISEKLELKGKTDQEKDAL